MLILSRKVGEEIVIGDDVTVVVSRIAGNRVTIGVKAPRRVRIIRGELEPIVRSFDGPEPTPPAATFNEIEYNPTVVPK